MNMNNKIPIISTLHDRQEIVKSVAGFYALSNRELTEALTIIGTREGAGVNQHFQEIYRRQQNNKATKPENAIVAVTREYITNYRSSEVIARQLGSMALEINEIMNPNITLADEIGSLRSEHRSFIRYVDLKNAFSKQDDELGQKAALSRPYFAKDNAMSDYIRSRLFDIKVKDARRLVDESVRDQNNRTMFWAETLRSLKVNNVANHVIKLSLKNI